MPDIMNGILIIDKPAGITSHDVVAGVRRILGTRRVGHTGTLDPFATGLMVVLVGQATRLAQFLDKDEKEYEAVVQFGFETDTGDITGSPRSKVQSPKSETVENLETVLESFRGEIEQIPPMYSAKKVAGKKLYEHARKGETIEREPNIVTISEMAVLEGDTRSAIRIRVVCSAGTYIRTLAEDIGRKIGTGAHLAELRRTRAGKFTIYQALSLEQLEQLQDRSPALLPMEQAVSHLPQMTLADDRVEKTKSGLPTRIDQPFKSGAAIRMVDMSDKLIAIGFFDELENAVRPKVVLI